MIEPIILNKSFEKIGLLDNYLSFIWTVRFYRCGDFEIVVPVDDWHIKNLQNGFYIIREDDENAGIIEDISLSHDEESNEKMIISGRFLSSILARRIIATQTQLHGTVSAGVANLISDAIIEPDIPQRKINNFIVVPTDFINRLDAQYTGKNLLETVESICENNNLGFKTLLKNKNFEFTLYSGTNRSYSQQKNPYIVFSDEHDNLLSSTYEEMSSAVVTDVLVAGEGEGLDRKTVWASKENLSGLDRYELYHDQRNMSTNLGNITDEEYDAQMLEEGMEQITTMTRVFDGVVYFDNIAYRKDVFVGDIVVIENKKWGIFINSRLIEVIESVDESGEYKIVPTFGA